MGWRNIVVDGKPYRWRGSGFVVIQDGNGKRVGGPRVTAAQVKGITEHDWERGCWKRTCDGQLRPVEIAAFIAEVTKHC